LQILWLSSRINIPEISTLWSNIGQLTTIPRPFPRQETLKTQGHLQPYGAQQILGSFSLRFFLGHVTWIYTHHATGRISEECILGIPNSDALTFGK
jgi:hypothetical protein